MKTINEKVKQNIDRLFDASKANWEEHISPMLRDNRRTIMQTVVDYQYLQYIYKTSPTLAKDEKFITMFRQFYIMRYIPRHSTFENKFFEIMDEIRKGQYKELDAVKITNDLYEEVAKGGENNRNALQLSFVTKMLNLHNDKLYPIYDRQVGFVCGVKDSDNIDVKYKKVQAVYSYIKSTPYYDKSSIIKYFRQVFLNNDKEAMSTERIIDILLWQWGKKLEKEKHTVAKTPQEKHLENIASIEEWIKNGGKKIRMDMIAGGLDKDAVFEWFYKNQ